MLVPLGLRLRPCSVRSDAGSLAATQLHQPKKHGLSSTRLRSKDPTSGNGGSFALALFIRQRLEHGLSVRCQWVRLVRFHEANTHGLGDDEHVRRKAPNTVVDRRQREGFMRPSVAKLGERPLSCRLGPELAPVLTGHPA